MENGGSVMVPIKEYLWEKLWCLMDTDPRFHECIGLTEAIGILIECYEEKHGE